jgi:hypothetical protein
MASETSATSTDTLYISRLVSANSSGGQPGAFYVPVGSRGQIIRLWVTFRTIPIADWTFSITTTRGVLTAGAWNLNSVYGLGAPAAFESTRFEVNPNDPNGFLEPGDVIDFQTTTGAGASDPAGITIMVRG